jgi:hypothetical protein
MKHPTRTARASGGLRALAAAALSRRLRPQAAPPAPPACALTQAQCVGATLPPCEARGRVLEMLAEDRRVWGTVVGVGPREPWLPVMRVTALGLRPMPFVTRWVIE